MALNSTPRKIRPAADVTSLESVRDHLVEEIGHVQVYDPDKFLGTVFPAVSNDELSQVKEALGISDSGAWITSAMGGKRPGSKVYTEPVIFANIAIAFNKVAQALRSLGICDSLVYSKDDQSRSPEGETKYKTRPGACYVLHSTQLPANCQPAVDRLHFLRERKAPNKISWADVAGTDEYKRSSDNDTWRDVSSLNTVSTKFDTSHPERSEGYLQHVPNHGL